MKKFFALFIVLFLLNPCYAFWKGKKEKPVLYLSPYDPRIKVIDDLPLQNHSVFKVGEKIYFLVYTKEGFKSDYIKYQIVKQDDNAHIGGYTRIRNITRRIKDRRCYVDYFVLHESGKYALQVFDITNLHQWVAFGHFRVINE